MKRFLSEILMCPACLPREIPLKLKVESSEDDDIISGTLNCSECGRYYRIEEGIAILIEDPGWKPERSNKYENPKVVSAYLWSHYGDLLGDRDWFPAYLEWSNLIEKKRGFSLDLGCAVGRFVFELSLKSDFAIGLDMSMAFVRTSREIMKNRSLEFELTEEGEITTPVKFKLPEGIDTSKVEFIIADAQKLPFPSGTFTTLSSLNLIDKVPFPLKHLLEMNRVAAQREAQILVSDPFSWAEEVADRENWLGGKRDGKFSGFGIDNLELLLKGYENYLSPCWKVTHRGEVLWKIRNHRNHAEHIKSLYVKAIK